MESGKLDLTYLTWIPSPVLWFTILQARATGSGPRIGASLSLGELASVAYTISAKARRARQGLSKLACAGFLFETLHID